MGWVWRSSNHSVIPFHECHRNQNSATPWRSQWLKTRGNSHSKHQYHHLWDILGAELSLTLRVLFLAVSCCSSWEIWLLEFSLSLVRLPWSLWTSSTSWAISRSLAASSTSRLERVSTSMACSCRETRIRPQKKKERQQIQIQDSLARSKHSIGWHSRQAIPKSGTPVIDIGNLEDGTSYTPGQQSGKTGRAEGINFPVS